MSRERWEYRVVCADGNHRWGAALRYMTSRSRARFMRQRASSRAGCCCDGAMEDRPNPHTIERRQVADWERLP